MNLFYLPELSGLYSPVIAELNEEESFHCAKSLRLRPGETIYVTDGKGRLADAKLITTTTRKCVVEIRDIRELPDPMKGSLHIGIAPTKNMDRFEWFLEKATETGVSEITPLWCEHSERKTLKPERLEKIIISAMKQSQRVYQPVLNSAENFVQFVKKTSSWPLQKFLAYAEDHQPVHLKNAYKSHADCIILIGPEGDFSPAELTCAVEANYSLVNLGESRLRTETAALYACMAISIINTASPESPVRNF